MVDFILKLLEPIMPTLQQFITSLLSDIVIFFVTMSVVYTFGRMLLLTKSDRVKNSIALVTIVGLNIFQHYQNELYYVVFNSVIHSSIGILLYVLIGFKLFVRMDDFLDKHFGKDKIKRKK